VKVARCHTTDLAPYQFVKLKPGLIVRPWLTSLFVKITHTN
jgi:hypothetical protein